MRCFVLNRECSKVWSVKCGKYEEIQKAIFYYHFKFLVCLIQLSRRGYSVKRRLVKLTRFQCFPLKVSGYQDIPPSSLALRSQRQCVGWVLISVKSVANCILPNTGLQTMKNIDKFAACQTRPILTNTRNSHSHMLYKTGVLKNLAKFTEKHLWWSLFSNWPATFWKRDSGTVVFLWILQNV